MLGVNVNWETCKGILRQNVKTFEKLLAPVNYVNLVLLGNSNCHEEVWIVNSGFQKI